MNNENNKVNLIGKITSGLSFSHESFWEGFYDVIIAVKRLSGYVDYIPLLVSERLVDTRQDLAGQTVRVTGQFRSYNCHEEKQNRVILSVFAQEFGFLEDSGGNNSTNEIILDGYVCKDPLYRETPLGREIADLLLAVNRPYGKTDYIPCICWGRNARFASGFGVGEHVRICGRIQSRDFTKHLENGDTEQRTAYEVSANRVEVLK